MIGGEIQDILHVRPLEFEDRLVIIAYYKNVWRVPIIQHKLQQFVLRTAGVLEFVH